MDEQDQKRKDAIIVAGCEMMSSVGDKELLGNDDEGAEEIAAALIDALLCVVAQLEIKTAESPAFRRLARKLDEWPTRVSAYKNQWGVNPDFIASLGLGEDFPFRVMPPGGNGWRRDTKIYAPVISNAERVEAARAAGELQIEPLRRENPASIKVWTDEIVERIISGPYWPDHDTFDEVRKAAQDQIEAEERKGDSGAVLENRLRMKVRDALKRLAK